MYAGNANGATTFYIHSLITPFAIVCLEIGVFCVSSIINLIGWKG